MSTVMTDEQRIHIERSVDIKASPEVAFAALLEQIGPRSEMPDGTPMPMKIEAWPGGRWFRDLGGNAGHFWGHVQVIKPPTLLEITGPLFMSYPAVSHVQYRLTDSKGGTRLTMVHRAIGDIDSAHRDGVSRGWEYILGKIRDLAQR